MNIRCDHLLDAVAAAQAQGALRTFRGIKYSDADLHIYSNCVHAHGGAFDIAYGKDEQMLGALVMGAKAFVGSTYNYSGRVSNKVIELWGKGDAKGALEAHRTLQKLVNLLYGAAAYGPAACNAGKAMMEWRIRTTTGKAAGVFCGPPRAPGVPVTAEGMEKLKADLDALGFFQF